MNAPYKPTHTMRVFLFDSHLLCEGYCATPSLKQIVRDFATMCYKFHGPFNEEEQRQWNQLFRPDMDENTKEQLGTLLAESRERELAAALAEQREPHLHYPAIAIEEVRARIAALRQLDTDISQDEPNAIVHRLYHATITEEIDFLRMIEATYEGDTETYWECSLRFTPVPTPEEMEYALSRVRHYLRQGLLRP